MESLLARYLEPCLADCRDLKISHLLRIPGGASRETWMFKAVWQTATGRQSQEFILRKDPPASLLETDREAEYAFYSTFAGSDVPVPAMRWLETGAEHLGSPFFIMERIPDIEASTRVILEPRYDEARPKIARRMYEILAAIHTFDWRDTEAARIAAAPAPDDCWRTELDRWEATIDENELNPQPAVRAGLRWLRRNPPPPAQRVSVVHGDYRVGNILYHTDGGIRAVVDWEMAHLGDPIEDVAWSFMADWEWARDGLKGGIIAGADAIAIYEKTAGLAVDPAALHWWSVFSNIKAQGIWLTGAKSFQEGRNQELIMPVVAYTLINKEDENLLKSLGRDK
ncbi:MAG: phosphotransferase family protein [Chloroflexi bacterium]|nr:phosphotransferase family protein [Chloroflexota bacterium]